MADLTISVGIDARGTKQGAAVAKSELQNIANEAEKSVRGLRSIASLDFKALGEKLKQVGSMISDFGSRMQSIGTQLSLAVTAPLVLAGKQILTAGGEYEKALNIFQAVTKATSAEMERAAVRAKELGADLTLPATSAKDAALAMTELGKAGLTAAQAMDAAKGVLQLAAAGALDEARAAEIAANALNAFKLEASETVRIANLLAAAANASSSEVDDIALSMQQASASFSAAKQPIENLVTAIAAMANAGIKGSDAGTSLKTFILSLQAPTDNAAEKMTELGISIFDTAGKMRELPQIIGQFETALAGLTDEQKTQALYQIFGSDAIRAAQILFQTGTEGFNKLKEAVTANGAAAELANARMKGLTGAWEGFKSQLETIGIEIFEVVKAPLTDFLRNAADAAGRLLVWFQQLSPGMQQAIIAFAALAAAAGPLLVILGTIATAIGGLVTAIGTLVASAGTVGIALAVAVGLLVQLGPILAIAAAEVYVLYQAWQTNFGGIRDLTALVAAAVQETWNNAMAAIRDLTAQVTAEVNQFWAQNGEDIKKVISELSEFVRSVWTELAEFWRSKNDEIKAITGAAWEIAKTLVLTAVRNIAEAIKLTLAVINGDWSRAWEATKNILSNVVTAWFTILANAHAAVIAAVRGIFENLASLHGWILQKGKDLGINLVQGIISGIGSMTGPLGSAAASIINNAINRMRTEAKVQSPSRVTHELGVFIAEGLADGIKDGSVKAAIEARSSTKRVLDEINKTVFEGDFRGFLENAFDIMADKGKSFGEKLKSIFGGIVDNFRRMLNRMLAEWLNAKIFGGSGNAGSATGGFGGFGGFGTPSFNPGYFNGGRPANGSIVTLPNGEDAVQVNAGGRGPFGGGLSGTLTGIGAGANVVGGLIGGRAGRFISNIGTGVALGAQIGSIIPGIGTAVGAIVGGAVGFFASLFGGDPKRKRDKNEKLPQLNKGFTDALAELRALVGDVRTLRVSPDSAIQRATELRNQIASGFGIQFESKKYRKQAQSLIASRTREADALIEELRKAAEVARAASERDRRILPEFAKGVYLSPAFQEFRRLNGMIPGAWTGRDTIPALLARKEMVLNPEQQENVRRNAGGRDVFKGAGIPGYAGGTFVNSAPTAAAAPVVMETGPINVTVVVEQDTDGIWRARAESDAGQKVIATVVEKKFRNDELRLRRR